MSRQLSFVDEARACEWCGGPLPDNARADAETCSQNCRQSRHRFRVKLGPELGVDERPMRLAYIDPPYPGMARYYADHADYGGEVDHRELIDRAVAEFTDGWALSTSGRALRSVLVLCPEDVRVAIWVKGSRSCVSYRARSAYEPVIVWRGRERRMDKSEQLDDVLTWGGRQPSHPGALIGMKPAAFADWMFRQLGACRGDDLADLFPGSGAIARAWKMFSGAAISVSVGDPWNPPRMMQRRTSRLDSRLDESIRR